MKLIGKARSNAYRLARLLGDAQAITSGRPSRVLRRTANKTIGRKLIRRLWL